MPVTFPPTKPDGTPLFLTGRRCFGCMRYLSPQESTFHDPQRGGPETGYHRVFEFRMNGDHWGVRIVQCGPVQYLWSAQ